LIEGFATMLNDIRYALRLLRRSPGFTTAAVLTLALGIGANTAIYSVLQAVWLDAAPFFGPSRLVMLSSANDQWKSMAVSDEDFSAWAEQNTVFESLAATDAGGSLRVNDQLLTARWASRDLFATLNARMRQGRPLVPADGGPDAPIVAVLSYEAWQRRLLGDPGVVGRTFNSKMGPVEIVGVAPPDGVLINERAARELWPGVDSVLKRQFFNGNSRATVIGVVGDVRHVALDADPVSEIYYRSGGSGQMHQPPRVALSVCDDAARSADRQHGDPWRLRAGDAREARDRRAGPVHLPSWA